jgi:hypothetical protein
MPASIESLQRRIRIWLTLFIIGIILSGATAFPLVWEIGWLTRLLHWPPLADIWRAIGLTGWIERVQSGLLDNAAKYPFMAYGTDWLAFAHLVIAVAFVGPWRDPLRNRWVIEWGLINCAAVFPLAFICGPLRGIPLGWLVIDCCFGVFGAIPLLIVLRAIRQIEALQRQNILATPPQSTL